jgi:hypothetical protein
MKIVAVIILFVFGNMNDQETQMTQYFPKDAFCGPAYVEISEDGEVIKLYNEIPDGAVLVDEKITKEAMKAWTLRAKEKWNQ